MTGAAEGDVMKTINEALHIPVDRLLAEAKDKYNRKSLTPSFNLEKSSLVKKIRNERQMQKILYQIRKDLEPYEAILKNKKRKQAASCEKIDEILFILTIHLKAIHEKRLLFDDLLIPFVLDHGFFDRVIQLFVKANKEDPELTEENLIQALRHIVIMNVLQLYVGKEPDLSPEVYAFGLLYPYEDNYLDDPDVSLEEKKAFNNWLELLLNGEHVLPTGTVENKLVDFVHLIESTFEVDERKLIFESISLVHESQMKSLNQLTNHSLIEEEILSISFLKGGSTVLADMYLIKRRSELEDRQFAFELGTYLQLIDDLQDMKEDAHDGIQTLFTLINKPEHKDEDIKKLLSFIFKVNQKETTDTSIQAQTKEVLSYGMLILIMDAVGQNPDTVSKSLYKELESYSKVRLSFYKKLWLEMEMLLGLNK